MSVRGAISTFTGSRDNMYVTVSRCTRVGPFSFSPSFIYVNGGLGYVENRLNGFSVISAESSTWLNPGENEISIGYLSFNYFLCIAQQ